MPTKKEKIAIARIFADLIKADRIVDTGEMECWKDLCEKYSIDRHIHLDAKNLPFADALRIIKESDDESLRNGFLSECRAMTVSDGFCAHSEALIMIAIIMMLENNADHDVEVYSIPRANFNIDVATALYVESDYDEVTNEAIRACYRSVFKEFQLAGFHFVYLPQVIGHYRHTEPSLFKRMLTFLAPDMTEATIEKTYVSLMEMTTSSFCQDILCNKCGLAQLRNTYPALLIKIGNSVVGEIEYANYVKIEVSEDILSFVQNFVDRFCDMLSSDVYVVKTSEERDNQFHFFGFYKQLLDIFLVRRNVRSTVRINPYSGEIEFPEIDNKLKGIHRREKALYILLLCHGRNGIDFNVPKNEARRQKFEERMKKINAQYAEIYAAIGGERNAPDISVRESRSPLITHLRNSIESLNKLYNPQDYNISTEGKMHFAVHIEPDLIKVVTATSKDGVPLHESELYKRIFK